MRGGIARGIGFGFDDAPGDSSSRKLANNDLADQEARERDGFGRQFAAAQAPNQNWLGAVRTDCGCFGSAVWTGNHGVHFTQSAYSVDALRNCTEYCISGTLGGCFNFGAAHGRGVSWSQGSRGLPRNDESPKIDS